MLSSALVFQSFMKLVGVSVPQCGLLCPSVYPIHGTTTGLLDAIPYAGISVSQESSFCSDLVILADMSIADISYFFFLDRY